MHISAYIDHTLLKASADERDIIQLCKEAAEHRFYAVCVNGCYVKLCKKLLAASGVKVASVIGFPLGAVSSKSKTAEARNALADGADEFDMVINIGWLQSGKYGEVETEIRQLKQAMMKPFFDLCKMAGAKNYPKTPDDFEYGAVVGSVVVTGFIRNSDSGWAVPGNCHWELADAKAISPVKMKGQLKLFKVKL